MTRSLTIDYSDEVLLALGLMRWVDYPLVPQRSLPAYPSRYF